ncbi:MAG: GNAT family N-acetyltransferase [Saprospiraceae bacterium]|nr:GNAT family N-acetyltransferase [Saprospiraceae bacterium]
MKLRRATTKDWKLLLEWRNDPQTRENSITTDEVPAQRHKIWLENVVEDPNRHLYIAEESGKPVGTVRADYDPETGVYELSWTTAPSARNMSLGKKMVKLLVATLEKRVLAQIKQGNNPSIKIAEHAGLRRQKENDGVLFYTNY